MSSKPVVLFKTTLPAAETAVYTQNNGAGTLAIVGKFTGCNTNAGTMQVTVKIVPNGDTLGTDDIFVQTRTLQSGETYGFPELVGQHLNPGDVISVLPSATGLNLRGSGTLVTLN